MNELEAFRATLVPFSRVAKRIPDNWPGTAHLRIDCGRASLGDFEAVVEWVAYHGEGDCQDPILPMIGEWRQALQVLRGFAKPMRRGVEVATCGVCFQPDVPVSTFDALWMGREQICLKCLRSMVTELEKYGHD